MSYFIFPSSQALERALESWHWLDLNGKQVILVTAFADVFLSSSDGIWFLDTLEGNIKRLFETREELDKALATEHGQDTYLMSPLIDLLVKTDMRLEPTQCYDFKLHPRVGGQIAHENLEARDFVVANFMSRFATSSPERRFLASSSLKNNGQSRGGSCGNSLRRLRCLRGTATSCGSLSLLR